jgi:hypothetical protein
MRELVNQARSMGLTVRRAVGLDAATAFLGQRPMAWLYVTGQNMPTVDAGPGPADRVIGWRLARRVAATGLCLHHRPAGPVLMGLGGIRRL